MNLDPSSEAVPENSALRQRDRATRLRRASIGRALVAFAVFAPALVVLGVALLLHDRLYGDHHPHGPWWPWIVADVAMLLVGAQMMRGEDL